MEFRKKVFSVFKLLSVVMAVTIILTGCTGKQGEQGEQGERGPQGVAGKDGKTPTITINEEGYWVINGEVTTFKAVVSNGQNGVNGQDGKDGEDGKTPTITINKEGYWVINGVVTKYKATGNDGKPGSNGTNGQDGKDGEDGKTPTITINEEGYWVINGVVTEYKAVPTAITDGDGQTFHRLAPSTLSFRSNAPLSEFQEVQVNGQTVDPSNYTLTEGSTIVTFNIDYLKTLDVKKHEVTIVSDSGSPSAKFEVIEPETNEHGFYYNQPYTGYVSYYNQNWVFFLREDGIMDVMILDTGYTEKASYTFENDILTVTAAGGTFTGTVSETEIYCNELGTSFKLGDESIVADEDYIYTYKEELGGYEVNAIDKTKSEYVDIKTGINGIDTVALAEFMFYDTVNYIGNENMVIAPKIPNTVTKIGYAAFGLASNLTTIEIPFVGNSLNGTSNTHFGYIFGAKMARENSEYVPKSLTNVIVTGGTSIDSWAFYGCSNLSSVTIGNGVTTIGESAFSHNQLTSVTIGNSVTTIGDGAFANNQLTSVVIPDSVTTIGGSAFLFNQLTSVTIGNSVTTIGAYAFKYNELTSVTIGNGVKTIGVDAFYNNQLTSVVIPYSVTSIGYEAFSYNQLTSVIIKNTKGNVSLGDYAFGDFDTNKIQWVGNN